MEQKFTSDQLLKELETANNKIVRLKRQNDLLQQICNNLEFDLKILREDDDYFCNHRTYKYHMKDCRFYRPHGNNDNWDEESSSRSEAEGEGYRPCMECVYPKDKFWR